MGYISSSWLRAQGVAGDAATLEEVTKHAEAAIAVRVGTALAERLTPKEIEAFERLTAENSEEKIRQQWLEQHCPDYEKMVNRIVADFRQEIINSEYPITYILGQTVSGV